MWCSSIEVKYTSCVCNQVKSPVLPCIRPTSERSRLRESKESVSIAFFNQSVRSQPPSSSSSSCPGKSRNSRKSEEQERVSSHVLRARLSGRFRATYAAWQEECALSLPSIFSFAPRSSSLYRSSLYRWFSAVRWSFDRLFVRK